MANFNEILDNLRKIEILLRDLHNFFLERHHWGVDDNFINTINQIYYLIKDEKESLIGITGQLEKIVSLEEQILTNLSTALIDLRENLKNSMDSSVIEFKNAIELNVKEVRNATVSFNNYMQKRNFLLSTEKELTELKSKVHYFKKMQVGKDYFFSIQISYNDDNFKKLEIKDLDVISKELPIEEVPKKAEEGFIVRLISPTMTIDPPFRKVVIDSENKQTFNKHIYFKVTPNYSGVFIIIMEFILEDKVFFSSGEEFEVSVQDKGLEWKNKDKTHIRQISASAVKFFSINGSIIGFLGFDLFFQSTIIGSFFIPYLIFFVIAFISSYLYARVNGYGWFRKIEIVEKDPFKLLTITDSNNLLTTNNKITN